MTKIKKRFSVGVTYDQVTPESASNGDFSESGWVTEHQRMTLKEAVETAKEYYVSLDNFQPDACDQSLYTSDFTTIDYSTGTDEQNGVHITVDKRFKRQDRIAHWLSYALRRSIK